MPRGSCELLRASFGLSRGCQPGITKTDLEAALIYSAKPSDFGSGADSEFALIVVSHDDERNIRIGSRGVDDKRRKPFLCPESGEPVKRLRRRSLPSELARLRSLVQSCNEWITAAIKSGQRNNNARHVKHIPERLFGESC